MKDDSNDGAARAAEIAEHAGALDGAALSALDESPFPDCRGLRTELEAVSAR